MKTKIQLGWGILTLFAFGLFLIPAGYTQNPTKDLTISWAKNLNEALAQAKKENKLVFVDIYADWCGWCKRLEQDVFPQLKIAKLLNDQFIPLRIDSDENRDFSSKFNIQGLPTLLVLDKDGSEAGRVRGYKQADELEKALLTILKMRDKYQELDTKYEKNPEDLETLYHLGTLAWNSEKFEDAAKYLGMAVDKDPEGKIVKRETALIPLAKAYGLTGNPVRGSKYLEQFLKEFPQSDQRYEARFLYGVMLFEQGKSEESQKIIGELLATPGNAVPENIRSTAERFMNQLKLMQ